MRSWLRNLRAWWAESGCYECAQGGVHMPDGTHVYREVRPIDLLGNLLS